MPKALRSTALLVLLSSSLFAVTVFRVDPTPVMTTAGVAPPGGYPALYAVSTATINVCQDSACATPQLTYTDVTGSTACPIGAPVVLAGTSTCTSTTGPQGQFGFWLPLNAAGTAFYYKVIFANGQTFGPFPVTSSAAGVGSVSATSPLSNTGTASNPVIALTGNVPRANGGLNSSSPGTGILRDGTTPTASELSGDCNTSGSNVVTCPGNTKGTGLNGAVIPNNVNPAATNGSGQIIQGATQGNGTKTQQAAGAFATGDLVMYDANGNAIDSALVAANLNLPTPTAQLQYLRTKPNAGNNTTLQYSTLTTVNTVDYNFAALSPGGGLTSGIANTVTLAVCPVGVAGANASQFLYISGGVGTAEAVLVTGGTCAGNGVAGGTIIFTPANNHTGAWTITSATVGCQEAYYSNGGTGNLRILFPAGGLSIFAPCRIGVANVKLAGQGAGVTALFQNTANTDGIQFIAGSAQANNGISDMSIVATGTPTTSVGLNTSNQSQFVAERVVVSVFSTGIVINNGVIWTGNTLQVQTINGGDGYLISGAISNAITLNNFVTSPTVACEASVRITAGGNLVLIDGQIGGCQNAMLINPTGSSVVASTDVFNTYFDHPGQQGGGAAAAGININPTVSASVVRTRCTQCWFASSTGTGITLQGAGTIDGLLILNSELSGNTGGGLNAANTLATISNIQLIGTTIANNVGNPGVVVPTNPANWKIEGCTIGNNVSGWGAGTQTYGVFSNATTGYQIVGNTFTGNTTAPFNIGTTNTALLIANNVGVDDVTGTVASGATLTLPINSTVNITGNAAINTMNGTWNGARKRLVFTNAAPGGLTAAGNIYTAKTVTQNQALDCVYDATGTKWMCVGP